MKIPIHLIANEMGKTITALVLSFLLLTSLFAIMASDKVMANAEESADAGELQASASDSGEVIAASGSNRFIVWHDNTPGNYDILLKRSTNNGATWQAAKNISNNPGDSNNAKIAVSGSNVYVAWLQLDSGGTLEDIFFRRSTDNGATWKPKVSISTNGQSVSRPSMSISESHIHVVWNQPDPAVGPNWYQVYIRSSANGGATWMTPKDLTSAKETFLPALVASSGANVYVSYERIAFDSAPDLFTDILFLSSNDNGGTWNPAVTIASFVAANGVNGPWLAATGSKVFVFWLNADFHFGELYFRKSNDFGAMRGPVSGNLNNKNRTPQEVQVVASGSSIYLVWSNIWPFEVYFLRSTDSATSWDSVKNISSSPGRSYGPAFGR